MDMTAISVPTTSTAAAAGVQSQGSVADGQVSFSDFLSGLTGQGTMSSGQQTGTMTSEGLSWREMQTLTQLSVNQVDISELLEGGNEDGLMASIDALLQSITEMLASLQLQDAEGTLEAEDVDDLMKLVDELRIQMGLVAADNQVINDQLMTWIVQNQETQPETAIGGDGTTGQMLLGGNVLQELVNSDPAKLLSQLTGVPQENIEALLAKGTEAPVQSFTQAPQAEGTQNQSTAQNSNSDNGGNFLQDAEAPMETKSTPAEGKAMQADASFQSSIRAAKEQMADTKSTATSKAPVDTNELQRQVDEGVNLQNTAYTRGASAEIQAEQPVPSFQTQVQQGILTGIRQGDGEFTIKLVPEGLGELEVKLTKLAGGGMMLNIITKGDEAQRMLAADINALKEIMRPHQVQVESVMTEQEANLLNQQRSLEQQAWQNRRSSDSTSGESGGRNGSLAGQEDEEPEEALAGAQVLTNGTRLDAYI